MRPSSVARLSQVAARTKRFFARNARAIGATGDTPATATGDTPNGIKSGADAEDAGADAPKTGADETSEPDASAGASGHTAGADADAGDAEPPDKADSMPLLTPTPTQNSSKSTLNPPLFPFVASAAHDSAKKSSRTDGIAPARRKLFGMRRFRRLCRSHGIFHAKHRGKLSWVFHVKHPAVL